MLPWKSTQAKSPLAKKQYTCLPSVEGGLEAELASSPLNALLPPPIFFFQTIVPSVATHKSTQSLPSALVRKMRLPQTMGVEPPLPGAGDATVFRRFLYRAAFAHVDSAKKRRARTSVGPRPPTRRWVRIVGNR